MFPFIFFCQFELSEGKEGRGRVARVETVLLISKSGLFPGSNMGASWLHLGLAQWEED